MALQRHHKIMIGSFTTFLIVILIANSILLYILFAKLEYNMNQIEIQINELKTDTQSKINELTQNLIETRNNLEGNLTSLDIELGELKASASADFSTIIENSIKSVLTIRTDVAQGTGFVISDQGYIVTNAHVLSGGRQLFVIDSQQQIRNAELIGYNTELDVALIKTTDSFQELEFANSKNVNVGEKVIAIGNPLGLQFSVSEGIVSALDRPGPNGIEAYIQTDAALNPGNSGGPLINKNGEVIGINNFKVGGGENLGFALESNYLKDIVNEISQQALNQTLIA